VPCAELPTALVAPLPVDLEEGLTERSSEPDSILTGAISLLVRACSWGQLLYASALQRAEETIAACSVRRVERPIGTLILRICASRDTRATTPRLLDR